MLFSLHLILPLLAAHYGLAAAVSKTTVPLVQLDEGTFVGTLDGNVNTFLGIPFAKPP